LIDYQYPIRLTLAGATPAATAAPEPISKSVGQAVMEVAVIENNPKIMISCKDCGGSAVRQHIVGNLQTQRG
jgi:hypothetical protein